VFDFIEANFAILIVFEFFLMTAEDAEREFELKNLCVLCASAVNPAFSFWLRFCHARNMPLDPGRKPGKESATRMKLVNLSVVYYTSSTRS